MTLKLIFMHNNMLNMFSGGKIPLSFKLFMDKNDMMSWNCFKITLESESEFQMNQDCSLRQLLKLT